jgi:hypothetical protein
MSLPEFQRALSEMVMSPGFRNRVAEDPGSALAAFDLSDRERRRLEALARDTRLKTGTLLHRSTRLSMLSNTMSRTCRALGPQGLKELTHAYWSEHPPYSSFFIEEGIRFGRFALERLAESQDLAREVLETELALLELTQAEGLWEAPEEPVVPPASGVWVPRLHPLCRAVRFHHPPLAVIAELDAGRVPRELPAGEHYLLLFTSAPGKASMQEMSLDQGRALLAADGRSIVLELCRTRQVRERAFEELLAAGYLIAEAAPA